MKKTFFLLGPTDLDAQKPIPRKRIEGVGWQYETSFAGVLPILPFIEQDRVLGPNSRTVVIGPHDIELPRSADINLFNLVGDADASSQALNAIGYIASQVRPSRLFNAPGHVHKTARGRLQQTLADIPGCVLPRTESADPSTFDELREACRNFDNWPMILRARGLHGGEQMVMLTDESELESIRDLVWPYKGIFLIQHIDCRTEDGLYHKMRVIMIDGVAYARQCVYSDQWAIHAGSRADLMDDDISLCQREEKVLGQLREKGMGGHERLFQAISQRIGLDVFGIDFAVVNDEVVIFEANACMRFLGKGDVRPSRYNYIDSYRQDLRRALKKMLVKA